MSNKQCSDAFIEAFRSNCSGIVRTCACGRTHYNDVDTQFYDDEEEISEFRKFHAKEPDKYIPHEEDVGTMNVFGAEIVIGCICDRAAKAERSILTHKYAIASYFELCAEAKRKELAEFSEITGRIGGTK